MPRARAAISVGLLLGAGGCVADRGPPAAPGFLRNERMLFDIIEAPYGRVDRVEESGTIAGTQVRYRLVVDATGGAVGVDLDVGGRDFGEARLRAEDYPELDLSTLRTYAQSREGDYGFVVSLHYGEYSDCFIEDDGRNRIRLHFPQGHAPVLRHMTFRDCEPVTTDVALSSG
jgi:hypothetical protein